MIPRAIQMCILFRTAHTYGLSIVTDMGTPQPLSHGLYAVPQVWDTVFDIYAAALARVGCIETDLDFEGVVDFVDGLFEPFDTDYSDQLRTTLTTFNQCDSDAAALFYTFLQKSKPDAIRRLVRSALSGTPERVRTWTTIVTVFQSSLEKTKCLGTESFAVALRCVAIKYGTDTGLWDHGYALKLEAATDQRLLPEGYHGHHLHLPDVGEALFNFGATALTYLLQQKTLSDTGVELTSVADSRFALGVLYSDFVWADTVCNLDQRSRQVGRLWRRAEKVDAHLRWRNPEKADLLYTVLQPLKKDFIINLKKNIVPFPNSKAASDILLDELLSRVEESACKSDIALGLVAVVECIYHKINRDAWAAASLL